MNEYSNQNAGIGRRLTAGLVDLLIILVLFPILFIFIMVFFKALILNSRDPYAGMVFIMVMPLTLFIWPVVSIFYLTVLESSPKQAAFGKMLLGLKVTDINGNRISFLKSLKRNIVKILTLGIAPSFRDKITNCLVVKNSSLANSSTDQILSSDQIANQDRYAGFFLRLAALVIDLFILVLIGTLISSIVFLLPISLSQYNLIIYLSYIVAILMVFYFSWMDSSYTSGSFGKRIVGITVIDTNGNKISILRSFLRSFVKMSSMLSRNPFLIALALISVLFVIFSKKKQSLHDLVTGCVVVESRQNQTRVNKKGFTLSIIIILLLAILVAILGAGVFVGWRYFSYQPQRKTDQLINQTNKQIEDLKESSPLEASPTPQPSPLSSQVSKSMTISSNYNSDISNWLSYNNTSFNYQIQYPPSFKQNFETVEGGGADTYYQGNKQVYGGYSSGQVVIDISDMKMVSNFVTKTEKNIMIDGQVGYIIESVAGFISVGPIFHNGYKYDFYYDKPEKSSDSTFFFKMLETFRFTK